MLMLVLFLVVDGNSGRLGRFVARRFIVVDLNAIGTVLDLDRDAADVIFLAAADFGDILEGLHGLAVALNMAAQGKHIGTNLPEVEVVDLDVVTLSSHILDKRRLVNDVGLR